MSNAEPLHVVLGANGGAGRAIARALAERGEHVRAVSRSSRVALPQAVERMNGDVSDANFARRACEGATVVYDAVNVPYANWLAQMPPLLDAISEAVAASKARLLFVDNLYAYGKPNGTLTESSPHHPLGRKGTLRAQMADRLLAAYKTGKLSVAIARASDFYGDGANSSMTELVIKPALLGKKANWLGSLDMPHSLNYLDDFAQGVITLGAHAEAFGEVWHIPCAEPLTGRQFIEMVFLALDAPPRMGALTRPLILLASPFLPAAREELEELYQFELPFIMDTSKYKQAFGDLPVTPHRTAIQQTVNAYRQRAAAK